MALTYRQSELIELAHNLAEGEASRLKMNPPIDVTWGIKVGHDMTAIIVTWRSAFDEITRAIAHKL